MPYEVIRDGTDYFVVKKGTNKRFGKHKNRADALKQIAAIEASESGVSKDFDIIAKNDVEQIVYGVVMEPEVFDAHEDVTSEDDIRAGLVSFMKKSWNPVGLHHEKPGYGVKIVENYIAPADFKMGEQEIKKGSWVMGVYCPDEVWERVQEGEFGAFSIGGMGTRELVEE